MKLFQAMIIAVIAAVCCTVVSAYQRTADWGYQPEQSNVKAEFAWSRLSYNSNLGSMGYRGYGYGRWATWQRDYPKADRQFSIALNRLTRARRGRGSPIS
jgi:hypothetical protein